MPRILTKSGSGALIDDQAQACREEDVKHSAIHYSSYDNDEYIAVLV